MRDGDSEQLRFKGRVFTGADLELVREIVSSYGHLGRQELAQTVAAILEWERPNGSPKWRETRDLLDKLAAEGELILPELRHGRPRGSKTKVRQSKDGDRGAELIGSVRDVTPVMLGLVEEQKERELWRELVERHHYLGHRVPFGAHLRYLIRVSRPREIVVGCIQLSSPAWKVAPRDQWIGWDHETREQNLQMVVNNSRFLVLPWIKVKNLASHVLSLLSKQVIRDWEARYGVRPSLLETFVDSSRFRGTCYRASNWMHLGTTQGRGRMDREKKRVGAEPKEIFVRPLQRNARERLCGKA